MDGILRPELAKKIIEELKKKRAEAPKRLPVPIGLEGLLEVFGRFDYKEMEGKEGSGL